MEAAENLTAGMTDKPYGRVTVLPHGAFRKGAAVYVLCRCECGTEWAADRASVRRGKTKSCGCLKRDKARDRRTTHGYSSGRHPLYSVWLSMNDRCNNPNADSYPDYGGRGIGVHPEWLADRIAFYRYAITLPGWDDPELDIDRIDNNGGYVPGNLRLVPRQANTVNKRNSVRIEFNGAIYSLPEFAAKFCPEWHRNTVRYHLNQGRQPGWIVDAYKNREGL